MDCVLDSIKFIIIIVKISSLAQCLVNSEDTIYFCKD